jgi:hypothetical protein
MKPFESFLGPSLEEYLAYRRTLGYVDENMRSCLRSFDRYIKEKAAAPQPLTPLVFSGYAQRTGRGGENGKRSVIGRPRLFPVPGAQQPLGMRDALNILT